MLYERLIFRDCISLLLTECASHDRSTELVDSIDLAEYRVFAEVTEHAEQGGPRHGLDCTDVSPSLSISVIQSPLAFPSSSTMLPGLDEPRHHVESRGLAEPRELVEVSDLAERSAITEFNKQAEFL